MTSIQTTLRPQGWRDCALPLLLVSLAGCGGGSLDPLLGATVATNVPSVSSTSPAASTPVTTDVSINTRVLATFNKAMLAASITNANFSLACPAGTPVTATVSYDAASRVATLRPSAPLPPSTNCQATVGTGAQDSNGIGLANAFVWSFSTGLAVAADITRPTVSFTTPTAGASGVANNSLITATFSEAMAASSLTTGSFTVTNQTLGTAVVGTVAYSVDARTATFTPTAPGALLASGSLFTAKLSTQASDLAGNALAANSQWSFTTGNAGDSIAPTVGTITPLDGSTANCLGKSVSASFSEPLNPASVTSSAFTVTDGGVNVAGTVSYDAPSQIATFTPTASAGFAPNRNFVATLLAGAAGVKDLAGNPLANQRSWGFATGALACGANSSPVKLGLAASFGAFGGGAGVTNQGINTQVNGNLGSTAACTLITGFHDAAQVYTQTPLNIGAVNGSINCAPPAPGTPATLAVAAQARADAQTAYNALAALPPGSDPAAGQLGGQVLPAAVYTAAAGSFDITSGDLTLDGQGDATAVWVFQSASSLTVGLPALPRRVFLINGAQAKNVFWQVGSAARIEDGSTMVGTIIAPAGVTISTAGQTVQTTLIGRAIGLSASVTMVNTTVIAP